MALVSTDAIILQVFRYGDTSKILKLLTRGAGVQSVIAKGAANPKSKYGGILEPFTEGVVAFYARDNRDLHTLGSFELTRSRQAMGADLIRFGGASLIAELIMRAGIEEPDEHLYELVSDIFERIVRAAPEAAESTVLGETWALIAQLGFAPALDVCISCGRAIAEEEEATFDYVAGGVRCSDCSAGMPGRLLPGHARAALMQLMRGHHLVLERTAAHWRLLARFLTHHVVDGATLKSLVFIQESLSEPE
ncbi:MAG TPA: DNA repair protein RecO [Longimicrobiales bacterium]|nr:DNA repair protein RecO [Longimicrobiales bacterium]